MWAGNFRDLAASVTRLATLSDSGRIADQQVDDEIERLRKLWRHNAGAPLAGAVDLARYLGDGAAATLDLFDSMQLEVVIAVCRQSKTISGAGRKLYAVSRDAKAKPQ